MKLKFTIAQAPPAQRPPDCVSTHCTSSVLPWWRATLQQASLLKQGLALALLLGLCLLISSCQTTTGKGLGAPELINEIITNALKQDLEDPSNVLPAPEDLADPLSPNYQASVSEDEPINVAANNIPAREFFLSLVQELEANIIVHPDVAGTISINLKKVTLPEIMHAVANVYGYYVEESPESYYVYPPQLSTRIYNFNYIHLKRTGQSSTGVNNGEIAGGGSSSSSGGGARSSSVETESEIDFWDSIAQTLTALLGNGEGREVILNPHTGLVVIKADPNEHKAIEVFLSRAQDSMQRQVIIEAKILEVELKEAFQSGINWSLLSSFGSGGSKSSASTLSSDAVIDQSGAGGIFKVDLRLGDFSTVIELLETQGKVHTLSSPRISTVNNQKAIIKVGQDELFITNVEQGTSTVSGSTTTDTPPQIELSPFFSGIALDVTPQIATNKEIILHVHPMVSEVSDVLKVVDLGDDTLNLPLAVSRIRESDSIIRAKNKQVVIIGGLLSSTESKQDNDVPWLGGLPIIGKLFQQDRFQARKGELVILLKSTVVEENSWQDAIEESRRFLREQRARQRGDTAIFRTQP